MAPVVRVIVAGSRGYHPTEEELDEILVRSGFEMTELVCGLAPGVDTAAWLWAKKRGFKREPFPARWSYWFTQGNPKRAGPERNGWMAAYADALIALPTRDSRGTRDMIRQARDRGLPVYVEEI